MAHGGPKSGLNHNVKLALWWSLLENCSASVRSGDVLSALLFLLTSSNTTVGIVQGVNGVLQMLAALPAGWAADRYRRDTMLRCGAAVGAVAGCLLAYALALRPTVWWLTASMALLGCYRGIYSAALEAIWADSIQAGRSSLYTKRYALTVVASSFGPWLSLALFHFLGNKWHARDCRLVLGCGLVLMAAPLALMCCFDDDKALEGRDLVVGRTAEEEEARLGQGQQHGEGRQRRQQEEQKEQQEQQESAPLLPSGGGGISNIGGWATMEAAEAEAGVNGHNPAEAEAGGDADLEGARDGGGSRLAAGSSCSNGEGLAGAPLVPASAPASATVLGAAGPSASDLLSLSEWGDAPDELPSQPGWLCCGGLPPGLAVTLLISFSDFIGALASGMTLRFFSMWFMQEVGFSPIAVSLVGALSPLGISAASLACQPLSKRVGRVQISLVTRCLDIVLLATLAYMPTGPTSSHGLLVAVHLARMAVANATRPLMRSVLMDCVPRRHRGKVNAVDSVRTFSWSGSAALGGFLIERYGFQHTFLITAAIKLLAFLPLFVLLAYVPDGLCIPAGARAERLLRQQQWSAVAVVAEAPGALAAAGSAGRAPVPPVVVWRGGEEESLQQPLMGSRGASS